MSNFFKVRNKIGETYSPGTVVYLGELEENIFYLPGITEKEEDVCLIPSRRGKENFFLQKKGNMEELITYEKGLELIQNYWVEKDVPMILQEKRKMTYARGIPYLIMVDRYDGLWHYAEVSSESDLFIAYDESGKFWLFLEMAREKGEWKKLNEYSINDALNFIIKKKFNSKF